MSQQTQTFQPGQSAAWPVFSWWLLMWLQKGTYSVPRSQHGPPGGQLRQGPDHRESQGRGHPTGVTSTHQHVLPPHLVLTITTSLWPPMSPPGEGELVSTSGLPWRSSEDSMLPLLPGWGTKILHAKPCDQKIKRIKWPHLWVLAPNSESWVTTSNTLPEPGRPWIWPLMSLVGWAHPHQTHMGLNLLVRERVRMLGAKQKGMFMTRCEEFTAEQAPEEADCLTVLHSGASCPSLAWVNIPQRLSKWMHKFLFNSNVIKTYYLTPVNYDKKQTSLRN